MIGGVGDDTPPVGIVDGHPAGQVDDLARRPRGCVHPVGHRGDRHVSCVESRPQAGEHPSRDSAVEQAHAVGALAESQAHHRHVEDARIATLEALRPEVEHALDGNTVGGVLATEVLLDEVDGKAVDACRHRSVGREHGARARDLQRLVEPHARVLSGQLTDPFEAEEARMPLIRVEHLRCRAAGDAAVRAQGTDAADAEEHLLLQPVLPSAAVEPVGHLALSRGVLLDIGVEHEQRYASDLGHPDARRERPRPGEAHRDLRGGSVRLAQERHRAAVRIRHRIVLLLPGITGERLAEVAGAVEQAEGDDRHAEVAGGLQVIARQDPESAGVLRQGRGDAVLRREVRDADGGIRSEGLEPPRRLKIGMQVRAGALDPVDETVVPGELGQPLRGHFAQQAHRVLAARPPDARVDGREEVAGGRVPRPPEIQGELLQGAQARGQDGADGEPADGSHDAHVNAFIGGHRGARAQD